MDEHPEPAIEPTAEAEHESPEPSPQNPSPGPHQPDPEIDALRDLIARAYPDTVPELISGTTASEMLASVPAAQEAFRRIAEQARQSAPPGPAGPVSRSAAVDIESLPPHVKIREGLRG